VDSPYTVSQCLLTNTHSPTSSPAGRNFTVSETYLHTLLPQLPRTQRCTGSSFPHPSLYMLHINCTLTQISTRQNATAYLRRASRWCVHPLRMNVHIMTTVSLRIWLYDRMEVNRKIGRSFWLENLVEKCAYGARNPD
jgi:hypothetical protein